jgi:hypothetical protein
VTGAASAAAGVQTCAKVPFATRNDAWRRLFEIAFRPGRPSKPVGVYQCSQCSGRPWHLTRKTTR